MTPLLALAGQLKGRSLTRVADWSAEELRQVLDLADELKLAHEQRDDQPLLPGRTLGTAVGAQALYTDVWTSMGREAERERRLHDVAGYGIDEDVLSHAAGDAIVLHCLPAHCGEEITEAVLYGPHSAVWDQAENRLHARKALLALVVR